MLPTTFGNPLWFSDDELKELRGTTLYRATELQVICLVTHYLCTIYQLNYSCAFLASLKTYDKKTELIIPV